MKSPALVPVKSSNIAAVGYHDGKLHVQFKGGGKVYVYAGVPADVHMAMMASDSVGRFLAANIKGKYDHAVAHDR